jgi:long-subunit fatty acid transport protein
MHERQRKARTLSSGPTLARLGMAHAVLFTVGASALAAPAHAASEVVAPDGRSFSMGGASQGNAFNPAAVAINPAQLDRTATYSLKGAIGTADLYSDVPAEGAGSELHSSSWVVGGLLGAALRLSPRLTLGAALSPVVGSGGDYDTAVGELSFTDGLVEAAIGGSYQLSDTVSIGAAYRITYARLESKAPIVTPGGPTAQSSFTAWGVNFLGFGVGMTVRPDAATTIGLAYRTRVVAGVSGSFDTSVANTSRSVDGHTSLATPDRLALGASREFLDGRIVVAAEIALLLESWLPSTKTTIGGMTTFTANENPNVWNPRLGAEFWVTPAFALRLGALLYTEPASAAAPSYFQDPPALDFFYTGGLGLRLGHWRVDAVVAIEPVHSATITDPTNGNAPGRYARGSNQLGITATFDR